MEVDLKWEPGISDLYPGLAICTGITKNVENSHETDKVQQIKQLVYETVRATFAVETLKDNPTVRAYRDFYWRLGIDPTKTRPSGEALLRRALRGDELPSISPVVDAYNLASTKTIIPISGFDLDLLKPPLHVRFSGQNYTFKGIGMTKPMTLTRNVLVVTDTEEVLCVYPHRDADATKITPRTRNVIMVAYGAPGIPERQLKEAVETTLSYVQQVAKGTIESVNVFRAIRQ